MLPEDERVTCSIMKNFILLEQKNVIMHLHKVQEQIGSNDCGALAIAFASSLACGLNPTCCSYKQENLRAELAKVFTSKLFHPFRRKVTHQKEVREEGRQFQIRGPEKAKADLAKECLTDKTKRLLEEEDWRSAHIGFILLKISVSI
ncbi:hypothetical protein HELRODRAFT_164890 [Helobdella robusta]|uniref:Ubiquitin-like protease family profile domain-containing protein n=1 Tax=Helobdella robusta TaxID=6412 RepID=T1EVX4_HELRO|nr:hypothetical protein HELRODRAFT_164890 [Helobdella robusta]ESN92777.1 hypothetical protein HELRODRAFT_164890 [Helobdella robusta]